MQGYFLLMQDPQEIQIGNPQYVPRFSGTKRCLTEKFDTYQYVPLLPSLKKLLSNNSIIEQIYEFPHRVRNDGLIEDYCDALLFKVLGAIAFRWFNYLYIILGSHPKRLHCSFLKLAVCARLSVILLLLTEYGGLHYHHQRLRGYLPNLCQLL